MEDLDALRLTLQAVARRGDIVDVALTLREHLGTGRGARSAKVLRDAFELTIRQAVDIAAWVEAPVDDEPSRAALRSRHPEPLCPRM